LEQSCEITIEAVMSDLQRRRTHNLLLISRLFNQRENSSPFTLLIDSLEQSAGPILQEYVTRAKSAKIKVVWLSFDSIRLPYGVDTAICAAQEQVDFVKATQEYIRKPESRMSLCHL
jgi:elongator complex protein 5